MKTKANFEPHTMYHPKTGEAVMANSFEKHLELKNMRYGHSKPAKKKAPKKKAAKKKAAKKTKSFTEAVESRLGGY
tara:strand:- start:775 stop:1002 length:228 start_codon:yes stop_codon:yes gene_type:complete